LNFTNWTLKISDGPSHRTHIILIAPIAMRLTIWCSYINIHMHGNACGTCVDKELPLYTSTALHWVAIGCCSSCSSYVLFTSCGRVYTYTMYLHVHSCNQPTIQTRVILDTQQICKGKTTDEAHVHVHVHTIRSLPHKHIYLYLSNIAHIQLTNRLI
jgi:hypothetical protein